MSALRSLSALLLLFAMLTLCLMIEISARLRDGLIGEPPPRQIAS